MDWKLCLTTFFTVFVAELGDKTQVATFTLASGSASKWAVFVGSASALVATSAIAVTFSEGLARWISPQLLSRVAGGALVAMGLWMLMTAQSDS